MTMGIAALTLKHKDTLIDHETRLHQSETAIGQVCVLIGRGFFGRLSWLLRGK